MKNLLATLGLLLLAIPYWTQINNGSFENWRTLSTSPISEDPIGWTSNNPGVIHHYGKNSVEKSSDYYTGNFALIINQFYDSTSTCKNNFVAYKEYVIDTSLFSDRCVGYGIDLNTSYDTLNYHPLKLSFYYKTVGLKPSAFNYFEINVIDTTHPFGLPNGSGLHTIQLTPSATYVRKEVILNTIIGTAFQLVSFNVNIRNSFDSLYQNGYVLIDNMKFEGITGIEELSIENQVSPFPNPARDRVTINSGKLSVLSIEIRDIQGKLIRTVSNSSSITSLDVSELNKGLYLLKIKTDKGMVVKKIVKE